MESGEVLRLIAVHRTLEMSCPISDMIGIEDDYTAFCFNEACALIIAKLKDGEEPVIRDGAGSRNHEYANPSSVYSKFNKQ